MYELLELAQRKLEQKGEEHNTGTVGFRDYCPFGLRSAATFVHREALRVCVCITRGNIDEVLEHLIDTVVFAILMWEEIRQGKWKERVL